MSAPLRATFLLAAGVLLVGRAVAAQADEDVPALLRRLATAEAGQRGGLASDLGNAGAEGLDLCFDVLVAGRIAFLDAAGAARERALDPPSREVLLDAFGFTPRAALAALLERRSSASAEQRRTVLLILERHGRLSDLRLGARCATPPEQGLEPRQPALESGLRRALAGIFERHEGGLGAVRAQLNQVDEALHDEIYAALGDCRTTQAFELLATLLEAGAAQERLLLLHLGRAAARQPRPVAPNVRRSVRRLLASGKDAGTTREAALAAGRMGDDDAVEALVALLAHENRGVAEAAHWALVSITDLPFTADAGRWRAWFEGEQAWWSSTAPKTLEALRTGSRPLVAQAVNEVGSHRWRRAELADALAAALPRSTGATSISICSQLRQLGVLDAVPALVEALGHAEGDVRVAAHRALTELTGLDLPPDEGLWRNRSAER